MSALARFAAARERLSRKQVAELPPIHDTGAWCCSICRDEDRVSEPTTTLDCTHKFHSLCVDAWYERDGACPLCRKSDERPDPCREVFARFDRMANAHPIVAHLALVMITVAMWPMNDVGRPDHVASRTVVLHPSHGHYEPYGLYVFLVLFPLVAALACCATPK